MFHIIPVSFPDAQDFESPPGTISFHLGNHPAHDAISPGLEKQSAVLLPQGTLVPKFKGPINERWLVMVKIIDNEVLFAAWLRFSPRAGDSCIELENQVSVVAHSLASGVQSFANTKAGTQCTDAGDPEER